MNTKARESVVWAGDAPGRDCGTKGLAAWTCDVCWGHVAPSDGLLQFYNANADLGPVGGYPISPSEDLDWIEVPAGDDERDNDRGLKLFTFDELTKAVEAQGRAHPTNIGIMVCHSTCDPYGSDAYHIDLAELESAAEALDLAHHLVKKKWIGKRDITLFLEKCRGAMTQPPS